MQQATNAALAGAVRRTAPKALADYIVGGGDSAAGDVQIIGVSRAKAQLATNKARGISSLVGGHIELILMQQVLLVIRQSVLLLSKMVPQYLVMLPMTLQQQMF